LLSAGSIFAFLAEQRTRLFPPELFEDLFPSGLGRPSAPPEVVATVMCCSLCMAVGPGDRQAVTFDRRWKAAVGLPVTATTFQPTTLTVWRRRLAASAYSNRAHGAPPDWWTRRPFSSVDGAYGEMCRGPSRARTPIAAAGPRERRYRG
jgi:hypothetical protein